MVRKIPFERVQLIAGHVHILRPRRYVQDGKNPSQLTGVRGLNAPRRTCSIEGLKTFVAESDDHSILYLVTIRDAMKKRAQLA